MNNIYFSSLSEPEQHKLFSILVNELVSQKKTKNLQSPYCNFKWSAHYYKATSSSSDFNLAKDGLYVFTDEIAHLINVINSSTFSSTFFVREKLWPAPQLTDICNLLTFAKILSDEKSKNLMELYISNGITSRNGNISDVLSAFASAILTENPELEEVLIQFKMNEV